VKARIQGIEAVCLVSDNRHLYITCEVLLFIKTIYLFNSHPGRPCNGAHANLTHILYRCFFNGSCLYYFVMTYDTVKVKMLQILLNIKFFLLTVLYNFGCGDIFVWL
jgi:hypothetical protein